MAIFCGGSPDCDSHLCKADAFSNESISHPHGDSEYPHDEFFGLLAYNKEQDFCCISVLKLPPWLYTNNTTSPYLLILLFRVVVETPRGPNLKLDHVLILL
ncbi:hypothetical protein RJT34_23204 [Clitoria ternatea]|uniref:Uncharacterized protein n=1 Tax=Clitoria ternatea TaxID=43366 RepID=A0AAN9FM48_CLITE